MALVLSRLGAFSHRRRLPVVLVWLAVLVAGGIGAATLSGETSNSFSIPGQESTVAQELITEEFGAGGATVDVAVATPEGEVPGTRDAPTERRGMPDFAMRAGATVGAPRRILGRRRSAAPRASGRAATPAARRRAPGAARRHRCPPRGPRCSRGV